MGGTEHEPAVNGTSDQLKTVVKKEGNETKHSTATTDVEMKDSSSAEESLSPKGNVDSVATAQGHRNSAIERLAESLKIAIPEEYGYTSELPDPYSLAIGTDCPSDLVLSGAVSLLLSSVDAR